MLPQALYVLIYQSKANLIMFAVPQLHLHGWRLSAFSRCSKAACQPTPPAFLRQMPVAGDIKHAILRWQHGKPSLSLMQRLVCEGRLPCTTSHVLSNDIPATFYTPMLFMDTHTHTLQPVFYTTFAVASGPTTLAVWFGRMRRPNLLQTFSQHPPPTTGRTALPQYTLPVSTFRLPLI